MTRLSAAAVALVLLGACRGPRPLDAVNRVRLGLAHDLAARRDYGQALALVTEIHEDANRTPETLTLRATILRRQGLHDDAEADLREALKLDPRYAPAHDALAVLLVARDRAGLAEAHHRRAIELDERNPAYRNNWGWALLLRGRTADAIEALREAVRLEPGSQRLRNNLGFAYARAGDFARAGQQFNAGGNQAQAHNNLGVAYESAGNLPRAFEEYLAALRIDPALETARANLRHVARVLDRAVPPEVAVDGGTRRQP